MLEMYSQVLPLYHLLECMLYMYIHVFVCMCILCVPARFVICLQGICFVGRVEAWLPGGQCQESVRHPSQVEERPGESCESLDPSEEDNQTYLATGKEIDRGDEAREAIATDEEV